MEQLCRPVVIQIWGQTTIYSSRLVWDKINETIFVWLPPAKWVTMLDRSLMYQSSVCFQKLRDPFVSLLQHIEYHWNTAPKNTLLIYLDILALEIRHLISEESRGINRTHNSVTLLEYTIAHTHTEIIFTKAWSLMNNTCTTLSCNICVTVEKNNWKTGILLLQ